VLSPETYAPPMSISTVFISSSSLRRRYRNRAVPQKIIPKVHHPRFRSKKNRARPMSAVFHYRHASSKNQEIMRLQIFTNI
jgi:hypothetical protein